MCATKSLQKIGKVEDRSGGAYIFVRGYIASRQIRFVTTTGEEGRRRCTRAMQTGGLVSTTNQHPREADTSCAVDVARVLSVGGDNNNNNNNNTNSTAVIGVVVFQAFKRAPTKKRAIDVGRPLGQPLLSVPAAANY